MTTFRLTLIVIMALTLAACGGASQPAMAPMPTAGPSMAAEAPAAPPALERGAADQGGNVAGGSESSQQTPSQRLIVKNATVSLEVTSVPEAEAAIRARAEQLGGFVVSVETSGTGDWQSSTITFRVPAQRFEEALSGVEGLATRVFSRSVSGEDVTEEFVDLESRLRNLEATRDRLLDLLARAEKVEDALSVNQALTDVQGQIEQIKGRMQYLQQSAAMSTITAELRPVPPPPAIIEEDAWQPVRVAREALRGLVEFGQGLVNLAIVFAIWTPVWLPLFLFGRWSWRRLARGGKKAPPEMPPPPAPDQPPAAPPANKPAP